MTVVVTKMADYSGPATNISRLLGISHLLTVQGSDQVACYSGNLCCSLYILGTLYTPCRGHASICVCLENTLPPVHPPSPDLHCQPPPHL